jgi:hypothetical protein
VYKQTLGCVKLTTGKKGQKTELTGKGPLRRRRSALDCSATEEEEEEVFVSTCDRSSLSSQQFYDTHIEEDSVQTVV